jgi:hypothetical protein
MTTKQKPAHTIRLGSIKAAIWKNETESGPRFNVTIARLYKDGDTWKQTESFGRDELPLVEKVSDLALAWILQNSNADRVPTA